MLSLQQFLKGAAVHILTFSSYGLASGHPSPPVDGRHRDELHVNSLCSLDQHRPPSPALPSQHMLSTCFSKALLCLDDALFQEGKCLRSTGVLCFSLGLPPLFLIHNSYPNQALLLPAGYFVS